MKMLQTKKHTETRRYKKKHKMELLTLRSPNEKQNSATLLQQETRFGLH